MARVIVVGKGLAGCMAALAAREKGAQVTCVSRSEGRTAFSSGLIGVAGGITADYDVSLNETLTNLLKRRPRHPYALLENPYPALVEALGRFIAYMDALYDDDIADEQPAFRVLSEAGSFVPTTLAPRRMARTQDLREVGRVGVLHLDGYPPFRAEFLAKAWAAGMDDADVRFDILPVETDIEARLFPQAGVWASHLDRDENWTGFQERVAHALARCAVDAILAPPFLGLARRGGAAQLSRLLDCPVFEVAPLGPSCVPGLRLSAALGELLTRREVEQVDASVLEAFGRGGRIEGVMCRTREGKDLRLDADALILAGGKFLGGGLTRKNGQLRESVLGLPVMVGGRPATELFIGKITKPDFMKSQPFARAGLRVDETFRPLDLDGRPPWENLFAAGQILGGFDPFTDGCAEGVDILSGRMAGFNAAEVAG